MSLRHEKLTSDDSGTRILVVDKHAFDGLIAVWVASRLGDIEIILHKTVNHAGVKEEGVSALTCTVLPVVGHFASKSVATLYPPDQQFLKIGLLVHWVSRSSMRSGLREILVTGRKVAPAGPLSPHSIFCGEMCAASESVAKREKAERLNESWVRIIVVRDL